ncbi:hypothetical protein QEH52_00075 [Coraliomargarita sp. SDUM461003]|uniref:Uncharacterized protein n=1 Tax=Thalassobacterium maritimum TaxID=3041265 RepID=A0ABU1ANZ7_9BACT|nr:hypothetical protein [Coraliomargarita sp. SDUM461003]MDQ8205891.1 hypothetical protein [Coraliomargarita sp. SDUM461003]
MKIQHRVSFNTKSDLAKDLKAMGLTFKEGPIISTLEIDESDRQWPQIESLVEMYEAVDLADTKFTKKELDSAGWLRMGASWHHGYPMPDDDFGYLGRTYDLSCYDPKTGIGKLQKAPFQMKAEPVWKKNHLLQLNWIYDVFFVLPEVWESVFKPLGVECEPVVKYDSGEILKTVVQLKSGGVVPSPLELTGFPKEGEKYLPINKGYFPGASTFKGWSRHYLQSQEYFGSGASASKAIIVSAEFYSAMKDNKLKGVDFVPMRTESRHDGAYNQRNS